jgi:hypothetical protein
MAWKRLTRATTVYFVNLEEVAYLQVYPTSTTLTFSARGGEGTNTSITVDQSPDEILGGEVVT